MGNNISQERLREPNMCRVEEEGKGETETVKQMMDVNKVQEDGIFTILERHDLKLKVVRVKTNLIKYYFAERKVYTWNRPTEWIVNSKYIQTCFGQTNQYKL